MPDEAPTEADVAIVGYGPTGMTLAALLGAHGHRAVVLERHAGLYNLPRAACFDDEIMRTFQKLDLVAEVLPGTVVQPTYEWVNGRGETLLELSYDDPARCGWAALYMMYQPHLERVLDRRWKSLPSVEIRQGVTVQRIEAGAEGVLVSGVSGDDRTVEVRARFLVGADGGAGFVRSALGIEVSDYGFQENWLVCDFRKRRPLEHVPTFRQICDPAQPIAIVQIGPEHHRFSFMLDRDETPESATDERGVWKRVARYLEPDDAELVRVANYVFRSRIAERWREGPILLAGDAAHEMPPFLAQGMCSGIRDSHNLAWKLDLVLRGRAGAHVLDSYQSEREPHVRFITEKAIELGRVQTLRDPEQARLTRRAPARGAAGAPSTREAPLPGALVGADRGSVGAGGRDLPQGRVRSGPHEGLFDDLVGAGPCILARDPAILAALGPERRAGWLDGGGRIAVLVEGGTADAELGTAVTAVPVSDEDGVYVPWFAASGCDAAVIRPDWYLYGATAGGGALAAMVDTMMGALGGARSVGSRTREEPLPAVQR